MEISFVLCSHLELTYICVLLQLSEMQEEMERMKEENRMLRRVVDKTVRDYYELQMKLAAYQQQPAAADEPKVI